MYRNGLTSCYHLWGKISTRNGRATDINDFDLITTCTVCFIECPIEHELFFF